MPLCHCVCFKAEVGWCYATVVLVHRTCCCCRVLDQAVVGRRSPRWPQDGEYLWPYEEVHEEDMPKEYARVGRKCGVVIKAKKK